MANEDMILNQMEETRTALTEKLETLENVVSEKVLDTTNSVAETVESVKDVVQNTVYTVESVKDAFQDAVRNAKDSVDDTVAAVKDSVSEGAQAFKSVFDIPTHVENHPWAMMGGAAMIGFALGEYLARRTPAPMARVREPAPPAPPEPSQRRVQSNGRHHPPKESATGTVMAKFAPELSALKGLAMSALMGVVREMVVDALPENLEQPLTDIINSATEKMGGKPIAVNPKKSEPSSQHALRFSGSVVH